MIRFDRQLSGEHPALYWFTALLLLLALGLAPAAYAFQDRYEQARTLAFDGQRQEARVILIGLLEEKPEAWDARILLGRLYAWDKQYPEAREHLLVVLRAKPGYADARKALVDVEIWSDNYQRAVEILDEGLASRPTDDDFLYKKAVAQRKLGDLKGAAITLDRLNKVNPSHQLGARLFASSREEGRRHKISLGYGFTEINRLNDPWHLGSIQLSRRTGLGSFMVRYNYSNRFGRSAEQYEIDGYPRIMNGLYAFVNYGYSDDSLFPRHRYAAELYANLAGGVEISGGVRYLDLRSSKVTIYTGTLAKYLGNWWFSLRPYITPKSVGTSRSFQLTARRYFGDADNYVGLTGGIGSSPGEIVDATDLVRTDSWKVGLRIQKTLGDLFVLKLSGRYSDEELIRGANRREFGFGLGIERRF